MKYFIFSRIRFGFWNRCIATSNCLNDACFRFTAIKFFTITSRSTKDFIISLAIIQVETFRLCCLYTCNSVWFGFMVLNATFNNISVISWRSVLLVEEIRGPGENHQPTASHWQAWSHNVVRLVLSGSRTHNISGDRHRLHM